MIYIFNSAFMPTYIQNIYRLMGLPRSTRIDMRYAAGINAPDQDSDAEMLNSECIISYVDRFAENYIYYPFRRGRIRLIDRQQSWVYYNIELAEHCNSAAPPNFTRKIQDAVRDSPRLTNGEPTCTEDGIYCVAGPDLDDLVESNVDSWSQAADQIYGTKKFQNGVPALFLINIEQDDKKPSGGKRGLKLHANTDYELTVLYRYPRDPSKDGDRRIEIKMGSEIGRELAVGNVSDLMRLSFNLPPLDFSAGAITVRSIFRPKDSPGQEESYTATVPVRTQAWRSNLLLIGLLFAVAFLDEFRQAEWDLTDVDAWFATLFEFLKFAVVVWAVFKYRGKLKLPGL